MRTLIMMVFSAVLALFTGDWAHAQVQDEETTEKSSVCLPKYRLLAERNSEVPMQVALCTTARTIHAFPTRQAPEQTYNFHKKFQYHRGELVVHAPFRLFQIGISTAVDKDYISTSGYSNNPRDDETFRSDTAYIGVQWTPNLNTTLEYIKEHSFDYTDDYERFLPSVSYRPFGSFLQLNASIIVQNYRQVAKLAAFAEISPFHELGVIIQPVFDIDATTQKELIHTFKGTGYTLQTRFIVQENKGNPNYRSLINSDGFMLSQDLSFEILENNIVGAALSYAHYKKYSNTDVIYPDDYTLPPFEYPATEKGYGWGVGLNYSYLF